MINKNIQNERKMRRTKTLQRHIEKIGGVKKAFKELTDTKQWMPTLVDKNFKETLNRQEIVNIAAYYYQKLYSSTRGSQK